MSDSASMMVQADILKAQGIAAFRQGDLQAAAETFERALSLAEEDDDRACEAEMRVNLGVVHLQAKRYEQSEKELTRALEIFRGLGRRSEEAQALGNLGTLYERAGKAERAAEHYQSAAAIFGDLGEAENQQATLAALTRLQMGRRKWLQSLFTYEQALANGKKLTLKQRLFRWLFKVMSGLMRWR